MAWADINLDAFACAPCDAHAVGFFVGYSCYNANNATIAIAKMHGSKWAFLTDHLPSYLNEKKQ